MNDHNDFIKQLDVFIQKQKLNFQKKTDEELINTFNLYVGVRNWGHFISHYIKIMADEIKTRNFDSTIIFEKTKIHGYDTFCLGKKVILINNRLEFQDD
jgi:hypothetical protein